jgi:hypothetical protein
MGSVMKTGRGENKKAAASPAAAFHFLRFLPINFLEQFRI